MILTFENWGLSMAKIQFLPCNTRRASLRKRLSLKNRFSLFIRDPGFEQKRGLKITD